MSDDDPITRREAQSLTQSIRDLTRELRELRGDIADTYVRKDVMEPVIRGLDEKVRGLLDWQTWAQRLVLGVIIVAVLGLVLVKGGGG